MDECFNINWKKFTFLANEKGLNEVRSGDELLLHWNLAWLKDELVQLLHLLSCFVDGFVDVLALCFVGI